MDNTYDVYIAESVFDITTANTSPDRYHGSFLHFSKMSVDSLYALKSVADRGEIALCYEVNDNTDGS